MKPRPEPDFGSPDDLTPEWTAYESRWAVRVADFDGPLAAAQFLSRRKRIFAAASEVGIPQDLLTPFAPDKPGFETRVRDAFALIARTAGLAAE